MATYSTEAEKSTHFKFTSPKIDPSTYAKLIPTAPQLPQVDLRNDEVMVCKRDRRNSLLRSRVTTPSGETTAVALALITPHDHQSFRNLTESSTFCECGIDRGVTGGPAGNLVDRLPRDPSPVEWYRGRPR